MDLLPLNGVVQAVVLATAAVLPLMATAAPPLNQASSLPSAAAGYYSPNLLLNGEWCENLPNTNEAGIFSVPQWTIFQRPVR
jgi:hypothetical protein